MLRASMPQDGVAECSPMATLIPHQNYYQSFKLEKLKAAIDDQLNLKVFLQTKLEAV